MFSYCPNCGTPVENSEIYPFQCGSCDFTYFHNTASSVAAIIVADKKVLLTKRAKNPGKGEWDLPGGFVDPSESLEAALQRELQEELGVSVPCSAMQYLSSNPNIYNYQSISYHTCDSVFVIELPVQPAISEEQSEIAGTQWFSCHEIPIGDIAFESLANALKLRIDLAHPAE